MFQVITNHKTITFGPVIRCGCRLLMLLVLSSILVGSVCGVPARSTWTKGHRKILIIPVSFTDAAGPSNSDIYGISGWNDLTNGVTLAGITNFMMRQSYGQFSVDFTILP